MKTKLTMTAALLALGVTMTAATLGPPFVPPADQQCLVTLPGQPKTGERIDSRDRESRPCVPEPDGGMLLYCFVFAAAVVLLRRQVRDR